MYLQGDIIEIENKEYLISDILKENKTYICLIGLDGQEENIKVEAAEILIFEADYAENVLKPITEEEEIKRILLKIGESVLNKK